MKIYRGPSSKEFDDASHELVSSIDLSQGVVDWFESVLIRGNVTKDGPERQAVAHVEIFRDDLMALQRPMLDGLIARSNELDSCKSQLTGALAALLEIKFAKNSLEINDPKEVALRLIQIAEEALKRAG